MKRTTRSHKHLSKHSKSSNTVDWLPIDTRIFPHILAFGHVQGAAKLFLQIEIILAVFIVFGTIMMMAMKILNVT
jgi:hypothetical protein